jgi:hypothetical protein
MNRSNQAILAAFLVCISVAVAAAAPGPTPFPDIEYQKRLLEGPYDPAIPTPESLLGFPVGQRPATPAQIVAAIMAWSEASDRAVAVEYARSHENRPLYYVMISTPENLARADRVQADIRRLADPAGLSESDADAIIERLPGTAWMAYSIHGNEPSGADAALAAIYHLVASTGAEVQDLLDKTIVFIDPSQNPDGRARFVRSLEQHRGAAPNVDDQSLLHSEYWPFGRTNHYFFDLNRDFYFLVHPETRGRVQAINRWHPQIIIDGHEMGAQDTYLFSPAREPINRNIAPSLKDWGTRFASDQANAFDVHAWPYYTGEWNDNFYPGYSSYALFRGSLFILYEQAGIAEDGVRRPEGTVLTYREGVHHQLVSTMANLRSLAQHSRDMYRDFLADRRYVTSPDSPYANVSYVILPTANHTRWNAFVERMLSQDFEVYLADRDITVRNATDLQGRTRASALVPVGSLVIPNRQPEARLISAILEFDAFISDETLVMERQEILRTGRGTMYDTTAWNLEMMYGLDALRVPDHITSGVSAYRAPARTPALAGAGDPIAWIVDGAADAAVGFAARLMELGVEVRAIDKRTELDGRAFSRGSVMVSNNDNRKFTGDLAALIEATAGEMAVTAHGISAGLGAGELPDIGGRHFVLLERPQIAVLSRGGVSAYSFGAIWHSIDSHLGIRHSHLNQSLLGFNDLRRYNVLVLPHRWFADLSENELAAIGKWVEAGGTLVAIQGSVPALTEPEAGISSVRQIADTFADTAKYDVSLQREWLARQTSLDNAAAVRAHAVPAEVGYPFPSNANGPGEEALKKLDAWQSLFMPRGAVLAGYADQRHWLTFGTGEVLPVLYGSAPVLMSDDQSRAVVRMGVPRDAGNGDVTQLGWATIPAGKEVLLRMSGLVWPEAAQRIANSAYLTREKKGHGQIILFAVQPAFRGSTLGTNRLLLNALVYGPGMGTDRVVEP